MAWHSHAFDQSELDIKQSPLDPEPNQESHESLYSSTRPNGSALSDLTAYSNYGETTMPYQAPEDTFLGALEKCLQAIHRTPDSKSLQKDLFSCERIASALSRISNIDNAFPENLPVDLITNGHAKVLAELLEDVLLGHPD